MPDGSLEKRLESLFTAEENAWFMEGDSLDYGSFMYDEKGLVKQRGTTKDNSKIVGSQEGSLKKQYGIKISFELGLNPLKIKIYRDAYSASF